MELVTVSSEAVADYLPRCEALAVRLKGLGGAEVDDLVQEGLIFCWLSLRQGMKPRTELIRGRMLNWVRFLQRHDGSLSYEDIMEEPSEADLG